MINFTKKNVVTPEHDCYFFMSDLNTEIVFFSKYFEPTFTYEVTRTNVRFCLSKSV